MSGLKAGCGVAVLVVGIFGAAPRRAAAQAEPAPASPAPASPAAADTGRPQKSVYGTLLSVDKPLNGVIMKTKEGKRMAWRFERAVVEELAKFRIGDPMIVIYRQIASNEKRVTAVAFPGTAATPIYVNMTGSRILVRSSAFVDGRCGTPEPGPISESTIPIGGMAEVNEGCWCCAVLGESCTPGNKSGNGRALLVQCFK